MKKSEISSDKIDWNSVDKSLQINRDVKEVD